MQCKEVKYQKQLKLSRSLNICLHRLPLEECWVLESGGSQHKHDKRSVRPVFSVLMIMHLTTVICKTATQNLRNIYRSKQIKHIKKYTKNSYKEKSFINLSVVSTNSSNTLKYF